MSQGEVLMRRKIQNAILQKQRDGAGSSGHQQSQPSSSSPPPPFQLSTPKRHAAVDFTLPTSPGSAQATNASTAATRLQQGGGGGRYRTSVGLMDDLLDSPPRQSSPYSKRRPANTEHRSGHTSSADEQRTSQRVEQQQVEVIHELQDEIAQLTIDLKAKDHEMAKRDAEIRLLHDQIKQQEVNHTAAMKRAMLDVLDEASARVRTEGHRGIESIRRRLSNDDESGEFGVPSIPSSSTSMPQFAHPLSKRSGDTEEEILHRALVQSVRQRYMERLCS